MAGSRIRELKKAVIAFIDLIEQLGLGERIALIEFGGSASLVCSLTKNYRYLKQKVDSLAATGGTPMAEAMVLGIKESSNAHVLNIEGIMILPRIILMTDGEPDNESAVLEVADLLGQVPIPIACVGVAGCKQSVMKAIARKTGGMFVMAEDIGFLQIFFLKQVFLILYVVEMMNQIEKLYNREVLREYLQKRTGTRISDEELDAFIILLKSLVKVDGQKKRIGANPRQPLVNRAPSSGCCCTIL